MMINYDYLAVVGLILILTSDQLYKPMNVRSNVKRSVFQYDRCSNDGSNPIKSNVSFQRVEVTNGKFQCNEAMNTKPVGEV